MYLLIVVPKYVRWPIRFGAIGPADFQSRRLILVIPKENIK